MTPEERAELRKLADAATPGPWRACCDHQPDSHPCRLVTTDDDGVLSDLVATTHVEDELGRKDDQRFIAGARAAVPALLDEVDRLESRQQEHLQLIAKLTRETPYPDECDECRSARRALVAEVGTLRARIAELETALDEALKKGRVR